MTTDPRLPNLYRALDDIAAEIEAWPWMERYCELRLAHPEESPLQHMLEAKAAVDAGKVAAA